MNDRFYYHDIREIKNIENEKAHAMPHNKVRNMLFEQSHSHITNSIAQNNKTVKSNTINTNNMQKSKNNTIKKSDRTDVITTDNEGRSLTKEQQEFYEGNDVVDNKGNLQVVYHGIPFGKFTKFIVFSMEHTNNVIIQFIEIVFLTLSNAYVYIIACIYYNKEECEERNRLLEETDRICNDLNSILKELGLDIEDYYSELEKKL